MPYTNALSGLRVAAVVALAASFLARSAESSPIAMNTPPVTAAIDYATTGTVDSAGVTGTPVVRFQGVDSGRLTTDGTTFDLGRFMYSSLPDGQTTTYEGTPFHIAFAPRLVDSVSTPDAKPVGIEGWLYGTITGKDTSKLQALMIVNDNLDVEPYPSLVPPFDLGKLTIYLTSAPYPAGGPSPSGDSAPVRSAIYATEPVPEPTTLALFGSVGLALAFVRCRKSRRIG